MRLIFDTEGDGFLEVITKMHTIVCKDYDSGQIKTFDPDRIEDGIRYIYSADMLICHNSIVYDYAVINKLYGYRYSGVTVDSLVLSRSLNPDRKLPKGCPTHVVDPVTGKKKILGPHALGAYGYRFGRFKPDIDDWSEYTPEMKHRCIEDVEINHMALDYLLDEAGLELGDLM